MVIQCHKEVRTLRDITKFQQKIVHQWNSESINLTVLIIPPVSLRDEIKTNEYSMEIIETLCVSGLLRHVVLYHGIESW